MLEEFKGIYDIHRWLRCITWIGLLSTTLFLVWAERGFPPGVWGVLMNVLAHLPHLWLVQGVGVLLTVMLPLLQSLLWFIAWWLLVRFCISLAFHHWRQVRQVSPVTWMPSQDHVRSPTQTFPALEEEQATVEDDATMPMPRLRLPQRPAHLSLVPAGSIAVEDMPTVPVGGRGSSATATMVRPHVATKARATQPMEVGVGWNTGIIRRNQPNEDSLVVLQGTCTYNGRLVPFGLFVVADGMGGHAFGQEASRLAVQSMMQTVSQQLMANNELDDETLTEMMVSGVEQANMAICLRSQEWGKDMGTTVTAALVVATRAYVVNVGDSRTYLYREGEKLAQITRDHSLVARLVAVGAITPDEVYTHPERNKVFRSVGQKEGVEVDWFTVDLQEDDCLLLCSDGLWEMVRDRDMERIVRNGDDLTQVSDALVTAALVNGGSDNVSVIVVRVP